MPKPKIAFVVGHKHWGKSQTLRALTGGNFHQTRAHILDAEFFIRRMSNDDYPKGFIKKMLSLDPAGWPYVIAALCPEFEDPRAKTQTILESLRAKGYQLFFWVMERQYGTSNVIAPGEISRLRRFGEVEVMAKTAEAEVRARKFKAFVSKVVLA
jgi:hypothetical protein